MKHNKVPFQWTKCDKVTSRLSFRWMKNHKVPRIASSIFQMNAFMSILLLIKKAAACKEQLILYLLVFEAVQVYDLALMSLTDMLMLLFGAWST